jgi:hypothetical protein
MGMHQHLSSGRTIPPVGCRIQPNVLLCTLAHKMLVSIPRVRGEGVHRAFLARCPHVYPTRARGRGNSTVSPTGSVCLSHACAGKGRLDPSPEFGCLSIPRVRGEGATRLSSDASRWVYPTRARGRVTWYRLCREGGCLSHACAGKGFGRRTFPLRRRSIPRVRGEGEGVCPSFCPFVVYPARARGRGI